MQRNLRLLMFLIWILALLIEPQRANAMYQDTNDSIASQVHTCEGSRYLRIGRRTMEGHIVSKADLASPLLATVSAHASIAVRVFVDDDGTVKCAKALSGGTQFLRRLAEQAALKWRFSPVTEHGASVPFQGNIHFQVDL